MTRVCKNCGVPVRWVMHLQRYNHTDSNYDQCNPALVNGESKRAEVKD